MFLAPVSVFLWTGVLFGMVWVFWGSGGCFGCLFLSSRCFWCLVGVLCAWGCLPSAGVLGVWRAGGVGVFGAWLAGVLGAEWTVFSVLGGSERMSLCGSIPAVTAARGSCPKIYAQRTACALAAFG